MSTRPSTDNGSGDSDDSESLPYRAVLVREDRVESVESYLEHLRSAER
ncbi:hypothetical protein [Natronococcus wangiae]|nr:hypothetical protein [Natronococcus sp. AD5]